MNEEIKRQWVAALRSGEFTQTRGQLRRVTAENDLDTDGYFREFPAGYCCLGVLCELHARAMPAGWPEGWDENEYDGAEGILPDCVSNWAGLLPGNSQCPFNPEVDGVSLAELNDHGKTFEEIAAAIEEHL